MGLGQLKLRRHLLVAPVPWQGLLQALGPGQCITELAEVPAFHQGDAALGYLSTLQRAQQAANLHTGLQTVLTNLQYGVGHAPLPVASDPRSEERRVGKECRSGRSTEHGENK